MADWVRVTRGDPIGRQLADRHYSRQHPGSSQFMPPGRVLVYLTSDGMALWGTHWPDARLALDKLDAWRCSIFRNEGSALSSKLIETAMLATARDWSARPLDGWLTYVRPGAIKSANPGYCFKLAGWWLDRQWRRPGLIRLRAEVT